MKILSKKNFVYTPGDFVFEEHIDLRESITWTSQNGKVTLLKDIDINHLKNIIAKIERGELDEKKHLLFDLKQELNYRVAKKHE